MKKYPILCHNWTIKGNLNKFLLFDYKRGDYEKRYVLSRNLYNILRMCDGSNSIDDIEKANDCEFMPYYDHLLSIEEDLIIIEEAKHNARCFLESSTNEHFLERALWHITSKCNCDCKHCYMMQKPWNDLDWLSMQKIVNDLRDINICAVSLTGGEVFTCPNFFDLLYLLDENEIKIEGVFTNATLINEENLRKIQSIQHIPLFVSINGPDEIPHDLFMGIEGGYAQTMKNIKMATDMNITVYANTILSSAIKGEEAIKVFYTLVKDLGIKRWRVSVPFMEGSWQKNYKDFAISFEQELEMYEQIIKLWIADGKPLEIELGHVLRYVDGEVILNKYSPNDHACDYFLERVAIWPDATVSPCSMLMDKPYAVGNLKENTLIELWENPVMRYYKEIKINQTGNEECKTCDKISECGVGCRATAIFAGGTYEDVDPYTCAAYKEGSYEKIYKLLKEYRLI